MFYSLWGEKKVFFFNQENEFMYIFGADPKFGKHYFIWQLTL